MMKRVMTAWGKQISLCAALIILFVSTPAALLSSELDLDAETRAGLDAWELNRLNAADEAWDRAMSRGGGRARRGEQELFTAANAAYQSFIEEFPRSPAVAYALFRQGRSFHLDNKRDSARQLYQDIIEFFPNHPRFATAAIWYMGVSHQEDGNNDDAIRTWSAIARDKDYRIQPIAADALLQLGRYLIEADRHDEAIAYLSDMAIEFRTRNSDAARSAINLVVRHYVRRTRNESDLRDFYIKVRGFGRNPIRNFEIRETDQLSDHRPWWSAFISAVERNDSFSGDEEQEEKLFWSHWLSRLPDRYEDWDHYRVRRITWQRRAGGSAEDWATAIRAQYDARRGADGNSRVRTFMQHLSDHPQHVRALFRDLDWPSMAAGEVVDTVRFCFGRINDEVGFLALAAIPDEVLDDEALAQLASYISGRSHERARAMAEGIAAKITDEELSAVTRLRILNQHARSEVDALLAVAKTLHASERFASEAHETSARALMDARRWEEAVASWQAWGNDPDYRYRVAECYRRAGNWQRAAGELEIIERSFTDGNRPRAALLQAQVWDEAENPQKRDEVLVRILRNYRGTSEHSRAHDWRERLGQAYIGARD
ncbi:MAG: hypothetical protein EA401_12605 [Planctomycetota bacterium]|nr:MAG: hypothetical protein EA401_12605 [Planctomycetota bacterium]